jgi:hypothetical protein
MKTYKITWNIRAGLLGGSGEATQEATNAVEAVEKASGPGTALDQICQSEVSDHFDIAISAHLV